MLRFARRIKAEAVILGILLLQLFPCAAHALTFSPFANYSAGAAPQRMISADFNGGGGDLAVISAGGNNVTVFLNNGDGTFAPPSQYPAGSAPRDLVSADFNSDGKPDIAVANYGGNSISIFLNNGTGTFPLPIDLVPGQSIFHPLFVLTGDLDHDGHADLVVVNERSEMGKETFSLFRGAGDGTFIPAGGYYLDFIPSSAAMVDVSGKEVLAFTQKGSPSSLYTMVQDVDGYFPYANWSGPLAAGTDAVAIASGDVNGDLVADLVVVNHGSNDMSVYYGASNGTFAAGPTVTTGNGPVAAVLADLNSDGKLDAISANSSADTFSMLRGNGDGTFQTKTDFATGNGPAAIVAGDFNGDQLIDVITADGGTGQWIEGVPVGAEGTDVSISFNSSQPVVSFDPPSHDYGSIAYDGSLTYSYFTISNTGDAPLVISSIDTAGTDAAMFTTSNAGGSPCPMAPASLAPGSSCIVQVTFKPTSAGAKTADLRIVHAAPSSPATAALSGTGVEPAFYQLTLDLVTTGNGGTGSGTVTFKTLLSDPQTCTTSCSFSVSAGSTVILRGYPDDYSYVTFTNPADPYFITHTGTSFTMSGAKTFTVTFTHVDPVRVEGGSDYALLQDGYNAASEGAIIRTRNITLGENLVFNLNKTISLAGGYDGNINGFDGVSGVTTIAGSVTISDGTVTMAGIVITP